MDLILEIIRSTGGACAIVLSILLLAFWAVRKLTEWQCEMKSASGRMDKIEGNIESIKSDVHYIKGTLDVLKNNNPNSLVQSHSPISLTEKGQQVADDMKIGQMIADNWSKISACIEKNVASNNAYDIQQFCIETASIALGELFNDNDVLKVKDYAYKAGQNTVYYGGMIGVLIRDRYFKEKGISIDEVDKNDPSKK